MWPSRERGFLSIKLLISKLGSACWFGRTIGCLFLICSESTLEMKIAVAQWAQIFNGWFLKKHNITGRNIEDCWDAGDSSQNTPSETQDTPLETWTNQELAEEELENLSLFWWNWNSCMEHIFISGSINGWNQCFYKQKSQVLQLNSAGHFNRRSRLQHKFFSPVCPFC